MADHFESCLIQSMGTSAGKVQVSIKTEDNKLIASFDMPPDQAENFGEDLVKKANWVREHVWPPEET